jgi:hypothetical protein
MLALLFGASAPCVAAETETVRLAVVGGDPAVAPAADLLQATLSQNSNVILVERTEVQKLLREQANSAATQNPLNLGRILGADGLLLLDSVAERSAPNVNASAMGSASARSKPETFNTRLIAVRPGVVLAAEKSVVVGDKLSEWAGDYGQRLRPLLPKLAVPAKDAVPVSVVNLRSAVSMAETPELERQLQTLAIQRLSREPQLFVLERQKLAEAGQEKFLLADETAFWSGAWLLEGVADQSIYSKQTITLNVKLAPAQGGSPVRFEVSGSRTNLAEVINALAAQVVAALKLHSPAQEWNAAEEAAQFYEEAKWALAWGVHQQAQTAADAAWALGKRDLECALLRGKAYVAGVNANLTPYEITSTHFSAGTDANGVVVAPAPNDAYIQADINKTLARHLWGAFYKKSRKNHSTTVDYAFATGLPVPRNIERAQRTLELYLEYCRTAPDGQPQVLTRGPGWNDWHNSDWYRLGIDALVAASRVLQNFYFAPPAEAAVAAELADLRALARQVAGTISESPTVRDTFYVGGRIANHDELNHTMSVSPTIFSCMTEWGCFWQERPEEALALYRKLLTGPVFGYIHKGFWNRGVLHPRLVAWNQNDRARLPMLWDGFMRELNDSTNVLWRMEAKALARADALDGASAEQARQEWWSLVRSNRAELVANNVELFYQGWGFEANAETEAMNREYWNKTIPAVKATAAFEEQKKFLREYQPYDFMQFTKIFREKSYSQPQALELLPLIDAYKSNLLAQIQGAERSQKSRLENNARSVDTFLRRHVEAIAHPQIQPQPQSATRPVTQPTIAATPRPARPAKQPEAREAMLDTRTNIIVVKKYLEIPLEGLSKDSLTAGRITAHHLMTNQLLLDLELEVVTYFRDAQGKRQGMAYGAISAVAILDAKTERWQVIVGEETDSIQRNPFYHHTTLWRGDVFTSQNGTVRKYDLTKKHWADLELPELGNCALFVVNDRLYGANQNLIVEIQEGGAGMRILASKRRQPSTSVLDRETLSANGFVRGTPALFGDADGGLRAITANKIFSWNGTDWSELSALPQAPGLPRISTAGILLVGDGWNASAGVWRLPTGGKQVDYCLGPMANANGPAGNSRPSSQTKARWKLPSELTSSLSTVTSRGDDLLLLRDHSRAENIVNEKEHVIIGKKIHPQDGYHAELLCFSGNYALPQKLLLRFDDGDAVPPISGEVLSGPRSFGAYETWLCVDGANLYLGGETSSGPTVGGRLGNPPKIGIWVVALEQLDEELARQKKVQDAWLVQVDTARQKTAQKFLADFDRNQDGRIDGEEKLAAFTDGNYIASLLDQIDASQNGWLDADELKFFDANQSNTLEANEQVGLQNAEHLLAEQWLKKHDADGDGLLDRREFDALMRAAVDPSARSFMGMFPDNNRDQKIDGEEMQAVCVQQTTLGLSRRPSFGRPPFGQMPPGVAPSPNAGRQFKTLVEEFWRNGGTNAVPQFRQPGVTPPAAVSGR